MRRFFTTACVCVCRLCMGRLEVISPRIHRISLRSWLSLLSHVAPVPLSWDTESDISLPFSLFPLLKSTRVSFCLFSVFTSRRLFFFSICSLPTLTAHIQVGVSLSHAHKEDFCTGVTALWRSDRLLEHAHNWKRGGWGRNHTLCCPILLKLQAHLKRYSGSWPVDDILQYRMNAKLFMTLPATLRNVLVCICCSSAIQRPSLQQRARPQTA